MSSTRSTMMRHTTTKHAAMHAAIHAAAGGERATAWRAMGARRLAALGAILFTTVVWGLSFISTKTVLTAGLTPVQIAFARFSVASAIFLVLHALGRSRTERDEGPGDRDENHDAQNDRAERGLPHRQARSASVAGSRTRLEPGPSATARMLVGGILGVPVYFMLENGGLRLTSASTAALITGTLPVINALAVVALVRGRVAASQWVGIAISCAGIYAIAQADLASSVSGRAMLGNALVFLSVCAWIAYTMINKPLLRHYDNLTLNTYQTVAGTLFLLPFALHDGLPVGTWSFKIWLNVFYLGAVCSALAYVLYLFALEHLGSTVVTSCLNLVPVFGVLGGALLLAEPLSWAKAIGGLLALTGAYLVTTGDAAVRRQAVDILTDRRHDGHCGVD